MSSWPFTSAFHCSFGLNSDAPGYTCTSRSTPAALASRAMIWTISSRTSPRPPGNWCDARNTVGAGIAWPANSESARLTATAAAATPLRLKVLMSPPPELSIPCGPGMPGTVLYLPSLTPGRADVGGHPQLVLDRHHPGHGHHDPRRVRRLVAGRNDAAHAHPGVVGIDGERERAGHRIGAQRRPDARLQRKVGERPVRLVGFEEFRLPRELDDLVGALLDGHALGVERQVVAF